jgi:hypothetical protein
MAYHEHLQTIRESVITKIIKIAKLNSVVQGILNGNYQLNLTKLYKFVVQRYGKLDSRNP